MSTTNLASLRVVARAICHKRGESLTSTQKKSGQVLRGSRDSPKRLAGRVKAGVNREHLCQDGEIGKLKRLKISRWKHLTGSSPVPGTTTLGRIFRFSPKGCIESRASGVRCWLEKSTCFMCLDETGNTSLYWLLPQGDRCETEEGRESRPTRGALAQLVRACGLHPQGPRFES